MANITIAEANAWADHVKLNLTTLDTELEASVASQVLSRVSVAYVTDAWSTPETTPSLVRKIIAMLYTSWYFQRTYAEEEDPNNYGLLLQGQAELLLTGITDGSYILNGETLVDGGAAGGTASFYPTDYSSSRVPTADDMSLGPAKFSMGQVW